MDSPLLQIALAVGLGLLVGMQRERVDTAMGGVRTFALITLCGSLCAFLSLPLGGWILAAGLIGVLGLIITSNFIRLMDDDERHPGMTTEAASLVMFLVGAMPVVGQASGAIVTTGVVALLLHFKAPLHAAARNAGDKEVRAVMQFVLIALVILPLLPDRTYGPLSVLNPFRIWMMVVLIVGISLAAYAAVLLLGSRVGALLAGVLGGLISSTATTVSYARKSREAPDSSGISTAIILIASTIVFARILLETSIVAPTVVSEIAPPLLVVMGLMALLSVVLFFVAHRQTPTIILAGEPSELNAALLFGALYAVILLAVALVKEYAGSNALFVVAAISGMTDMDAITLSTADLIKTGHLDGSTGWRIILVAAMSNIVFKAGMVMMLGAPALRRRMLLSFGIALTGATAVLILWPG